MSNGGKLYDVTRPQANAVGFYENKRKLVQAIRVAGIQVIIVPHHRTRPTDFENWLYFTRRPREDFPIGRLRYLMEMLSNPAGCEKYEVSVSPGFRPYHDRVFGFKGTAQPDSVRVAESMRAALRFRKKCLPV